MPDFYFLGNLVQYWKVIYVEYTRLTAILRREPFTLMATELKFPLSEYEPKVNEQVQIHFLSEYEQIINGPLQIQYQEESQSKIPEQFLLFLMNEARRSLVVSVQADSVLDTELVNLVVKVYPDAFKKKGQLAYARWKEIKNGWKKKELLINPAENIAAMTQFEKKPKKQETSRYFLGIHGMLIKIAYRHYCYTQTRRIPKWSYKFPGMVDNKTANSIDRDLKGKIKAGWYDPNVSGDLLTELLFKKYKDFEFLKTEWEELKNKEF